MITDLRANVDRVPTSGHPENMLVQFGLLTLGVALAGEVFATTVLLQSRFTTIPGPDLDADGDIPGASDEACIEWATDAEFSKLHRTPWLAAGDNSSPTYRTHRVQRHLQLWFTEGRDYRSPAPSRPVMPRPTANCSSARSQPGSAFGSIRMEPVFMTLGQSAATATCLTNLANQYTK